MASFFVSRVDTLVDKLLEKIGTPEALDLRGKVTYRTDESFTLVGDLPLYITLF